MTFTEHKSGFLALNPVLILGTVHPAAPSREALPFYLTST